MSLIGILDLYNHFHFFVPSSQTKKQDRPRSNSLLTLNEGTIRRAHALDRVN